jgi:hypothetical protein
LDRGDIEELAALHASLGSMIDLRVIGGCCGTDHEHVATIANALGGAASSLINPTTAPAMSSLPPRVGVRRERALEAEAPGRQVISSPSRLLDSGSATRVADSIAQTE